MNATDNIPAIMSPKRAHPVADIFRDTGRRLLRFIRARVASESDADDILQEVWQQLIETLADGPIEQVGAWLYTVARRRIIDRYRKAKTVSLDAMAGESDELPAELLLPPVSSAAAEAWRELFWADFRAALAELPTEQRQVFLWHEMDNLSFQDIAALTGEKINTLLSRKRYAVLHLRRRLKPWLEEFDSTNS